MEKVNKIKSSFEYFNKNEDFGLQGIGGVVQDLIYVDEKCDFVVKKKHQVQDGVFANEF